MADAAQVALEIVEMARAGRFDAVQERFAPSLRSMVTAEAIRAGWEAETARLGDLTQVGAPLAEPPQGGVVTVKVALAFAKGALTLLVSVTEDGARLAGLRLAPASAGQPAAPWEPPAYSDPAAFTEREVTVGDGPLAVSGTLSLPGAGGSVPGVVLLAGSGSQDRDETIGPNKPLKDIAWGLASHGIAVLRFDKVTRAHPREVQGITGFTLSDEYVPHAVAAVQLLREAPGVDPARVFVLGHSLGGTVAPRVAAAEPGVAGVVLLAGGAQPMYWAAVRQVRYLSSQSPQGAAASAPVIEAMTRQAERVDRDDLSASTPASELPFGIPAPYWLDVRGYRPAEVAAGLGRAILVLHGGRDYQVTDGDDLAIWRAALEGRPGVTIRVYPAANHLFVFGSGPPSPAEYERAGHVEAEVVADIAHWVLGERGAGR